MLRKITSYDPQAKRAVLDCGHSFVVNHSPLEEFLQSPLAEHARIDCYPCTHPDTGWKTTVSSGFENSKSN